MFSVLSPEDFPLKSSGCDQPNEEIRNLAYAGIIGAQICARGPALESRHPDQSFCSGPIAPCSDDPVSNFRIRPMRLMLLGFGLLCFAATAFLAVDGGVWNPATLFVALVGTGALAGFRMVPRGERGQRHPQRGAQVLRPRAVREQASTLSGNLQAIADARAGLPTLAGRTEANAYLNDVGRNQIAVIKAIRGHLKIGLKDAKELTDAAKRGARPGLGRSMPIEAARALAQDVAAAGGQVEFD
jgi:ribosomal protein L7/L12